MRYVIMADGKGSRWNNYTGTAKHLAEIKGEPIIVNTVKLLKKATDEIDEILVTSHNPDYEFEGCTRYEPMNNHTEIDRFTEELVQDDICFLYGDTLYSEETMERIVHAELEDILFFGNGKSIVAVWIKDSELFKKHFHRVKKMPLDGEIETAKGWQIYQSVTGQNLKEKPVIREKFIQVDQDTKDINTPEDYEEMKK